MDIGISLTLILLVVIIFYRYFVFEVIKLEKRLLERIKKLERIILNNEVNE